MGSYNFMTPIISLLITYVEDLGDLGGLQVQ